MLSKLIRAIQERRKAKQQQRHFAQIMLTNKSIVEGLK
jgi:hypothetical protein